jgi:hypothetical protein
MGVAEKPKPEAVAGKTYGAWRSWMRSISPACIEEVLGLYEKPLSARELVVCIDEKPSGQRTRAFYLTSEECHASRMLKTQAMCDVCEGFPANAMPDDPSVVLEASLWLCLLHTSLI